MAFVNRQDLDSRPLRGTQGSRLGHLDSTPPIPVCWIYNGLLDPGVRESLAGIPNEEGGEQKKDASQVREHEVWIVSAM